MFKVCVECSEELEYDLAVNEYYCEFCENYCCEDEEYDDEFWS